MEDKRFINTGTPEIGKTVYLRPTVYNRERKIREGILTKIGRKYYTITSNYDELKFDLDDRIHISNYAPDYTLYFSKMDLERDVEREYLLNQINELLKKSQKDKSLLSYTQVRQIAAIANIMGNKKQSEAYGSEENE